MRRASQIGVAVLLMMAGQTLRDAWGWPPTDVEIVPPNPTTADTVAITVSGGWPDTCIPNDSSVLVTGYDIYVDVMWDYDPFTMCAAMPMGWKRTESVGPLAAGTYDVYARLDGCPNLGDHPPCPVRDTEYMLFAQFMVVQSIIYVDADASGANNGSSWADALNYLQDALMVACEGEEIRVAQGVYRPDDFVLSLRPNLGRMETFQLKNGVAIRGGYAGFGEPDPDARDIGLYETVLSGDLNGDDGPAFTNRTDNSYHVVTASGTDETAVLDGFTVSGGNADGPSYEESWGGGMYNSSASPTIINCTFTGNCALDRGGGMYIFYQESCPTLTNCTFAENLSASMGGGICNYGRPILTGCTFRSNWALSGGAMWCDGGQLNRCTFNQNEAAGGGGMFISYDTDLNNCLFIGNSAGIGGAVKVEDAEPTLTNCTFSGNSAQDVAGLYNDEGTTALINCIFWGNSDSGGMDESAQIETYDPPVINYCCIQGWTGTFGGTGNFSADPCFADPDNGECHLRSQAGRWDPASESWVEDDVTSLCIDAGDPASAVGDEPAPHGGRINMGAYGGTGEASKSPWCFYAGLEDCCWHTVTHAEVDRWVSLGRPECWCYPCHCRGDATGNCGINALDLLALRVAWPGFGGTYDPCVDTNYDGLINAIDVRRFREWWPVWIELGCIGCPGCP